MVTFRGEHLARISICGPNLDLWAAIWVPRLEFGFRGLTGDQGIGFLERGSDFWTEDQSSGRRWAVWTKTECLDLDFWSWTRIWGSWIRVHLLELQLRDLDWSSRRASGTLVSASNSFPHPADLTTTSAFRMGPPPRARARLCMVLVEEHHNMSIPPPAACTLSEPYPLIHSQSALKWGVGQRAGFA